MSDIFDPDGYPFQVVVPITHRTRTVAQWLTQSERITTGPRQYPPEPGRPSWPVENDPKWMDFTVYPIGTGGSTYTINDDGKYALIAYSDDINQNGEWDDIEYSNLTGDDRTVYYYDSAGNGVAESSYVDFYNPSNATPSGEYVRTHTFENDVFWCQYDLSGIDASLIQRAELVANLNIYYSDDPPNPANSNHFTYNAKARNILFQFQEHSEGYKGWPHDPNDFRSLIDASVCPPITNHDVLDMQSSSEPHMYWDYLNPYQHGSNFVLPINSSGLQQLRRGGSVGLEIGFDAATSPEYDIGIDVVSGSRPTRYSIINRLVIACAYLDWDSYPTWYSDPADMNFFERAASLPQLRIWLGGGVEIAGEAVMKFNASGAILDTPEPSLVHQARLLRDQS